MSHSTWIYRIVAIVGVLASLTLAFSWSHELREPDSWAYYYAAENFAQGQLVIDDSLHLQQVAEAREKGGFHAQYVRLDNGNWALEKAPGYVFFLVPFHKLGIPWAANLLLALGMAAVVYLLLKRMKNEVAACIGVLILFFMPMSLIMLHRTYTAMFGATAFLVMGAGLYIYETIYRGKSPRPWVLFLAGLLMSWSVVARLTNILVVALFALHFGISRGRSFFSGQRWEAVKQALPFVFGIAISIGVLLAYNNAVFGSPWSSGYDYTRFEVSFAFEHLGETTPEGGSVAWEIFAGNCQNMPLPLLIGFPVLPVALIGTAYVMWQKGRGWLRQSRDRHSEMSEHPWPEMPWTVLALLIGWFLAVFGLYFLYTWTSRPPMSDVEYVVLDRFYLPGLFPLVAIAALALSRVPRKLALLLMITFVVVGSVFLVHWVTTEPGLPPWPTPSLP